MVSSHDKFTSIPFPVVWSTIYFVDGSEIAPISGLINQSIEQESFPSVLKKASVVPLYKKADKLEKSNYRPISLLPILAKIFEKVLAHQISPFLYFLYFLHTILPFVEAIVTGRLAWSIRTLAQRPSYQTENRSSSNRSEQGVRLYASRAAGVKAGSLWCSAKIL